MRRRFPVLLGLLFISVTIRRIADFSGGDALAWTFALGLAVSVFAMAYYSRFAKTQASALVTLVFLVIVDGMFNLSEVLKWSVEVGRWNFPIRLWQDQDWYIYRVADFVYGLFPTIAAMLLGWVTGRASQIPIGGTRRGSFRQRALAWLADTLFGEEAKTEDLPEDERKEIDDTEDLPPWLPILPTSRSEFLEMIAAGRIRLPEDVTGERLAELIPAVKTDRTGRNWLKAARNGKG